MIGPVVDGVLRGQPGEADGLAERRAPLAARDPADVAAVADDRRPFGGHGRADHLETCEDVARPALSGRGECVPPDEVGALALDQPAHRRTARIGQGVGVLADDGVLLLEPEHPLGLHAEGPDPGVRARRHQGVPQVRGLVGRDVELVGQLADEADAQDGRRDPGDEALAGVEVAHALRATRPRP